MARLNRNFNKICSLLNDWYGPERAKVEITAHTPKVESVGEAARRLLKKTISPDLLRTIEITENWPQIAGPQIARIAAPVSFKRKILYIQVSHSIWLQELSSGPAKEMIIRKINELYEEAPCREIKFLPAGR
ncbi:MAG: DUF721 domain-containing protein [Victivallaceae bacterium]|nr:DUF721 domain-containing protein [Victivallaceae bacterium]